tara:strand:- start:26 stop:2488 length:2463 start_codon:yes stop_codon:yes gene_type:complete
MRHEVPFQETFENRFELQLDEDQIRAVKHKTGNALVTARAGAGKTRTLIARSTFLQKYLGVSPSEILLLSFNKKAAEEMKQRLQENLGTDLPHVMTFHALAHALVRPKEQILCNDSTQEKSDLSRELQIRASETFTSKEAPQKKESRPTKTVQDIKKEILKNFSTESDNEEGLFQSLLQILFAEALFDWSLIKKGESNFVEKELATFERVKDLLEVQQKERDALGYAPSLDGTRIKSSGERLISNVLFLNGIDYKYEHPFEWEDSVYRPDFLIKTDSGTNVVIEYFGCLGDSEYEKQAQRKRKFWEHQAESVLFEISPRDIAAQGEVSFEKFMLDNLQQHDVKVRKLTGGEIIEKSALKVDKKLDETIESLMTFISYCRLKRINSSELKDKISDHLSVSPEEKNFLNLASVYFPFYENTILGTKYEDFNGLLWRAIDLVRGGSTQFIRNHGTEVGDLKKIKFVLIDEFQDFSYPFFELIQAVSKNNDDVNLFCVGDDWQAINTFAGSDLKYFQNFGQMFSPACAYELKKNYRSSKKVVTLSNIVRPGQGHQSVPVRSENGEICFWDASKLNMTNSEISDFDSNNQMLAALLRLVKYRLENQSNVVLLGRNKQAPNEMANLEQSKLLGIIKNCVSLEESKRVSISTIHKYKGRESEAVIIYDAVEGRYPFIHPDWIHKRIFGEDLYKVVQNEKRLFYVALTRAVDSIDLITFDQSPKSSQSIDFEKHPSFFNGKLRARCVEQNLNDLLPLQQMLEVRVSNAYNVKDTLKAKGFRFNPKEKYWWKLVAEEFVTKKNLDKATWNSNQVDIQVLNKEKEIVLTI